MGITSLQGLAVLVEDDDTARCLGKLLYIIAHTYHTAGNGRVIGSGKKLALVVGGSTEIDESILVTILANDGCQTIGQRMPPLELSTPKSTKLAIYLTVVILEHTRVDRERAANGLIHGFERSLGLVGHSDA